MLKNIFLIIAVLSSTQILHAQIQSGSIEPEEKEKKENKEKEKTVIIDGEEYVVTKKKKKKEKDLKGPLPLTGRFIYASAAPSWTHSTFEPEFEGQFSNRSNENAGWAFTTEAGINVSIKDFFQVGVGFGYMQYNQSYQYSKPDSISFDTTYSYQRKHQYIFIPLRLRLIHGQGNFKFFYGVNIMPGMQLNQNLIRSYRTSDGVEVNEEKVTNRNNINSFQLMLGGFIGAEYHFSDHFSAFISPEFRYHPFNTNYNMRYTNNLYGLSIRVGLQFQL